MKFLKNRLFSFFLSLALICSLPLTSFAYQLPENCYTMNLSSNIGDVQLAVPYNMARYLSFEDNKIVNQYSSNVTLYGNTLSAGNSREFTVRLSTFSGMEYKYSESSYQYAAFTIDEVYRSNVPFLQETDFTVFSQDTLVNMAICLILGSIVVLLLKRR